MTTTQTCEAPASVLTGHCATVRRDGFKADGSVRFVATGLCKCGLPISAAKAGAAARTLA